VLALAVGVRLAVALAYRPALFFAGDSSQYLKLAFTGSPVGFAYERPSGYPLLIDLVTGAGRDLAVLTTVQHLAGLATGVLTYTLLRRLGVRKSLSTLTAAIVLLDAYAIALEQHVLAEAFFTLALVGSAFLLIAGGRQSLVAVGASSLLLGVSATLRLAVLFAIPVWLLYVIWAHGRVRAVAAAGVGLAVPLLAYATWHSAETGRFGLADANGWFLYGRVAEIGDCSGADVPRAGRALCRRTQRDAREGSAFHLWSPEGTAHRAFGRLTGDPERQQRLNDIMRDHAIAIIRARPVAYARMVGADFLRYFTPGVRSRLISDSALNLPTGATLGQLDPRVKRRFYPALETGVHEPGSVVRAYQRVVHIPRWLVGGLTVVALIGLLLPALTRGRQRLPHRREIFLLCGGPLCILIGATATSDFVLRYLIPVVPLLLVGGVTAATELARLAAAKRATRTRVAAWGPAAG
jgi:hypothetical protein